MFACDPAWRVRRRLAAALVTVVLTLPSVSARPLRVGSERLKPRALPSKSLVLAIGLNPDPRVLVVKLADDVAVAARNGALLPAATVAPESPFAKSAPDPIAAERQAAGSPPGWDRSSGFRASPSSP
jgi:hypothetical protein